MSEPAIRLESVEKRFGSTRAVAGVSFEVPAGAVCGFLGPNGAGKSTTIRMIMSIIYPDEGRVRVLGDTALAAKDHIGYLPEERGLYRKMRVGEYLRYMARLKGVDQTGLDRRIADWLERVELPGVERKRCEELSKGMQQKVQILAAIINDPELLILDEPFSGLDPVNAQLINALIRELHQQGTTIIFSTHILHQAEQICDRILLINKGRLLLDDPLDDIWSRFDPRTVIVEPLEGGASSNGASPDGFADLPGVASCRRLSGDDGAWELSLDDGADPQAVMRTALEAGPLRRAELRRATLDDVFVRLVRQDLGEAAAAEAREELSHA